MNAQTESQMEITDEEFQEIIKNGHKLVVVDFYAEWCMPCKAISSTMEELSIEYNHDDVKILKANVDENINNVSKFGIAGVPAILFFKDGKLVNQKMGLRSKKDLKNDIEVICNGQR